MMLGGNSKIRKKILAIRDFPKNEWVRSVQDICEIWTVILAD